MGKISFQAFLCLDFSENKLFIVIKHVEKSIVLFSVSNKILYLYLVTVTHYVLYIRTVILSLKQKNFYFSLSICVHLHPFGRGSTEQSVHQL
jgi:hypothetical protein